jgi:hypothetical protein
MAVSPALMAVPHRKWMETLISFDASNCPKSMVGARQLPLLVSPTIASIKLYHVLIDGGTALNLISLTAFKKLQILMSKLQPSRPFSTVGPVSVMPRGCTSLPVTFGTLENFCTERILLDVVEVNLPFNTILVLAILKPNRIIRKRTDANCSSFHLRVFLGLSNPQGQR